MSVTNETRLTLHLQRQCVDRHGNVTAFMTTPTFESSTGEEVKVENTDFGAVMYIAAVLVFYSLGIVVMIVKYLKTERKELEEEMALDSFFKGIPSKRQEHNRDAVNRVAIRAFHTLTSGAKRQDQLLMAAQQNNATTPDGDSGGMPIIQEPKPAGSPVSEDSDSSRSDPCPHVLQREPSKYLPRVSLMFRDNRSNDRRKMYDNIRGQTEIGPSHCSLPSEQRSSSDVSDPLRENGRARFCSHDLRDSTDYGDNSLTSCNDVSNDAIAHKRRLDPSRKISQKNSVSFLDEVSARGKPPPRRKPRNRPGASSSSSARPAPKPAIKLHKPVKDNDPDLLETLPGAHPQDDCEMIQPDRTLSVVNGSVSPVKNASPNSTTVSLETAGDDQGLVQKIVTQLVTDTVSPSKGLLVSDV